MAQWIKNPPTNARDMGSIPGLRRSPGEGNGNPLQYSCLGRQEAWWATVHGVTKSQAQLRSDWKHTEHNRPQTCRMLVLYLPSREKSNYFRGLQNTFQNIYKVWYIISSLQSKIMKHTTKQERRSKHQQYLPSLGLLVSLPGRDVPGLMLQRGLKNGGTGRDLGTSTQKVWRAQNDTACTGNPHQFQECHQWAKQVSESEGTGSRPLRYVLLLEIQALKLF